MLPMHSNRTIRITVCGDAQTGKSSLISTAANDTFDARPPPVLPPVRLPRGADNVPMLLTDTSARPEDAQALDLAVQMADAVVICFDARRLDTLDSIRANWYPRVQRIKPDVPVILACCKVDLLEERQDDREMQLIREHLEQAVQDLSHVEVCLNCSSRTLHMVTEVFNYGLKSVLYPLQPVYDRVDKRLQPLCIRALKRIFVMCDVGRDGALSDSELNHFQQTCFNVPLTDEELQNVKQMVMMRMPNGLVEQGLTLEGFLFLHVLFIERGRLETTWTVLRKFGYNDELLLSDEVLDRVNWVLPPDQLYELSDVAVEFLSQQFHQYDEDSDGLLTWHQLDRMYSTVPPPVWQPDDWQGVLVPGTYGHAHRLEAFLLKWHYSVLKDPRTAVSHMLYMGFGAPNGAGAQSLLTKCVRRRPDRRAEMLARNTVHCYVFGPRGCGKSALLRALAGAGRPEGHQPATAAQPDVALGAISIEQGRERVLVMTEVQEAMAVQLVTLSQINGGKLAAPLAGMPDLTRCDVAAFLFDSSSAESFRCACSMIEGISTAAGDTLPCVLVACKDDLGMSQALEMEVAAACTELAVPLLPVSVESGEMGGLLHRLVTVSVKPEGFIPCTPARRAHKQMVKQMYIYSAAAAAVLAGTFVAYKLYSSSTSSTSSTRSTASSSGFASSSSRCQQAIPSSGPSSQHHQSHASSADKAGWMPRSMAEASMVPEPQQQQQQEAESADLADLVLSYVRALGSMVSEGLATAALAMGLLGAEAAGAGSHAAKEAAAGLAQLLEKTDSGRS